MTADSLLTAPELAARERVSVRTIYNWRVQGRGPKPVSAPRQKLRWRLRDVERWERETQKGAA